MTRLAEGRLDLERRILVDDELDELAHVVRLAPVARARCAAAPPRPGRRRVARRDIRRQTPRRCCGMYERKRFIAAKHSASLSTALSIVPAASTATGNPPSSSFVSFCPSERSTTGGPAAKTWRVPFTITDQCDRIARPAGPPAAVPSTALTTGTSPSSSPSARTHRRPGRRNAPGAGWWSRCRRRRRSG